MNGRKVISSIPNRVCLNANEYASSQSSHPSHKKPVLVGARKPNAT
jgi:hypothetical protein